MRTLFLSLGAASVALAAASTPLAAQKASDLTAVEAHIEQVTTMSATFSQSDRKGQTMTGKMLIKRPGKIRFEYQKGANLLIVGDGKSLNMIDYQVRQVQRWPIGESPLSALLDPKRDLKKYGKLVPTSDPNVVSVAVKDPKRPEYGTITMIFVKQAGAPSGLTLHSWVALDSQNNRTTVRLSNVKYNIAIANSAFNWKDPRPNSGPRK